MTESEFDRWLDYHASAFGGLSRWLNDQPAQTPQHWYRALEDVTLDQAKAATDELFAGDHPNGFSGHPRAIRKLARSGVVAPSMEQPKPRLVDGQWVYECHHCEDTGFVTIWSSYTMRDVRDEKEEPQRKTCCTACVCNWGQYLNERRRKPIATFDADMHVPTQSAHDSIEPIREFIDRYYQSRRTVAFDDFNAKNTVESST